MFAHCLYNNYSYSHMQFEISLMNLKKTLPVTVPRSRTTANVTPKTTNSNSVLPNTASNDIQQHVNSGDVDIRNLTITLIRTVVLQRS